MIRWPWQREARIVKSRPMADHKVMELQTAKEILAEVFHARPADVEEMILRRLERRNWQEEEREDGLWPVTFCLGD